MGTTNPLTVLCHLTATQQIGSTVLYSRHMGHAHSRTQSIAALYDAHVHEVYRFVYRRCRDNQLSEDITQETFLSVLHGPSDPDSLTVGWLLTVARNRLFDVLRRQDQYEDKLRLLMGGRTSGHSVDIVEKLRVEDALQQLSLDHRLVLTFHYVDGYSVPALAEHLGRTPKSVEALVTRARRSLRELLREEAEGGGLRG